MPFLMAIGSFRDHFWTSSSILVILAGFIAQRQPFLALLPFCWGFSIFSKHLFRLRLCRTEFFQPAGAVLKYGKCSLENEEGKILFQFYVRRAQNRFKWLRRAYEGKLGWETRKEEDIQISDSPSPSTQQKPIALRLTACGNALAFMVIANIWLSGRKTKGLSEGYAYLFGHLFRGLNREWPEEATTASEREKNRRMQDTRKYAHLLVNFCVQLVF